MEMNTGWGLWGVAVLMVVLASWILYRYAAPRSWREWVGCLATTGLYGVVRRPQYKSILLAIFGQLVHWPTISTLLLAPFIAWAYYIRLARREEARLTERFGETYRAYRLVAPSQRRLMEAGGSWKRIPDGDSR